MKIRILTLSAAAMCALAATCSADVISPLTLAREVLPAGRISWSRSTSRIRISRRAAW